MKKNLSLTSRKMVAPNKALQQRYLKEVFFRLIRSAAKIYNLHILALKKSQKNKKNNKKSR